MIENPYQETSGVRPIIPWWLEGRAAAEFVAFMYSPVAYGIGIPREATPPRHVLVSPGLTGSDLLMAPLASTLTIAGFKTHYAGINFNTPWEANTEKIAKKTEQIYRETGQPVILVGHSLAGIQDREVAKEIPHMVDTVVSLGSPIDPADPEKAAHPLVAFYAKIFAAADPHPNSRFKRLLTQAAESIKETAQMPKNVKLITAASVLDGIVNWRDCIDNTNPHCDNSLFQLASHCGMPWNRYVVEKIAKKLAQIRPGDTHRSSLPNAA